MANFPAISPDYGASQQSQPKTRVSQMGDGYEIRVNVGLGQNPKEWNLQFNNISTTEANTITDFLDNRAADGASFSWTPPDSSTSYKWVCNQWSRSIPSENRANISTTFRQVFEA